MDQLLAIALGGALGSVLRYLVSSKINQLIPINFPYGTLVVNVTGCFLIGFLSILLVERLSLSAIWRAGILIGFLGGFTTFSSFSLDTLKLYENGAWLAAGMNVLSTTLLCLLATLLGIFLGRNL